MRILPLPDNLFLDEGRFWDLVDNATKTSNECWEWAGGRWDNGYGVFKLFSQGKWRRFKAHRIAYRLHFGSENISS